MVSAHLIQGGNFKDALKASLLSGLTAGVLKGAGSGFLKAARLGKVLEELLTQAAKVFLANKVFIEKALNIDAPVEAATAGGRQRKP